MSRFSSHVGRCSLTAILEVALAVGEMQPGGGERGDVGGQLAIPLPAQANWDHA